jgi:hypothetical protein
MRFVHLLAIAAALALPRAAPAKAWKGIQPGTHKKSDVTTRFGEPSTEGVLGGRPASVYRSDRAIQSARQVQFVFRDDGVVAEINVFPATPLDRDTIEGTFGKPPSKKADDDFRVQWNYPDLGVRVFFAENGLVAESIQYYAPSAAVPAGAGAAPVSRPIPPQGRPPRAAAGGAAAKAPPQPQR